MNSFDMVMYEIDSEPIEEGINMDTAYLIRDPKVVRMRKVLKYAVKAYRSYNFDESEKYFSEAYKLCNEMKKLVDDQPEPEKVLERILSYMTPVFTTMKRQDSFSTGTYTAIITYPDEMSRRTKSGVKASLQERFNRFRYFLNGYVKASAKAKKRYEEKKKKMKQKGKLDKFEQVVAKKQEKLKKYKEKLGI